MCCVSLVIAGACRISSSSLKSVFVLKQYFGSAEMSALGVGGVNLVLKGIKQLIFVACKWRYFSKAACNWVVV